MTPRPDAAVGSGPAVDLAVADVSAPARPRHWYRLLTGPDDAAFCERVSAALADGYRLYGGPAATFDGERVIVAQAVVLAERVDADGTPR